MSQRQNDKPDTVERCVPRQDGQFLVITRKGRSAVSIDEVAIGSHVAIKDGLVVGKAHV